MKEPIRSFSFGCLRPRTSACLTKAWRLYDLKALARQVEGKGPSQNTDWGRWFLFLINKKLENVTIGKIVPIQIFALFDRLFATALGFWSAHQAQQNYLVWINQNCFSR